MLSSAISFSLMGVCVKAVGDRIPVAEVVLARSAVSLLLSIVMLRQAQLNPWGKRRGLLVLRGVIGTGALAVCVRSTGAAAAGGCHGVAVPAAHVHRTAGLAAAAREGGAAHPAGGPAGLDGGGGAQQSHGTGGMLGPLAALLGATATPLPVAGVLLAIAGAVLSACAYVSVRALGRTEHPLVIVFYFPLVGLLLTTPLVMLQPVWPTAWEALALVGVGLFTQLGQLGVTNGLLGLPAARATALSYGQVPLAALWGWLFFSEALDPDTAMAAGLVLAATLLSLRRSRP